jgi:cobalt/nickel transport system permease protein
MKTLLQNIVFKVCCILSIAFAIVPTTSAMHIMEGFLPPNWAIAWGAIAIPFILMGLHSINKQLNDNPKFKVLLAMAAAFVFIMSALKIPSVTGSCSHPTGIGLGAILFGPTAMTVVALIVLVFQALLLAHGGITTLGANVFSMGIVGPIVAFSVFKLVGKLKGPRWLSVFLGAAIGDLATYVTTSFQLAAAFPSETAGFIGSLIKFMGIFAITQIPLAISEGILTVMIFNAITSYSRNEMEYLHVLEKEV